MWEIGVIAFNTFRENLRDKILYTVLVFAVLLLGASIYLADLSVMEHQKIVTDLGLAAINIAGVIIAIMVGISLVTNEIERKTVYTILARPMSRAQFILGKYLGLLATIFLNISIMVGVFVGMLFVYPAASFFPVFQAIELIFVELMLLTAVAVFFSTFSSTTLSAIMTIGVFIVGHLTGDLVGLSKRSANELIKIGTTALYYLWPNLEVLNIKGQAAAGISIPFSLQATASAYGLCYAALLIVAACVIFQRRDF